MVMVPAGVVRKTTQCALMAFLFGPTIISVVPEMLSAPLVVKVPKTSGNVEKSYTAVMVTGEPPVDAF